MTTFYHEITPLTENDCFMVFDRQKSRFDFPIHYHEEFELTFIEGASGIRRFVGDHMDTIGETELVLVGSNLPHGWSGKQEEVAHEITVQFHKDLFHEKFLSRNQLSFVKSLLEYASRGVKFNEETILSVKPRLLHLSQKNGFDSVLELISILHYLSISQDIRMLASSSFVQDQIYTKSRRIDVAFQYMRMNYDKDVSLGDLAREVNMTEASFSRFIKKRTGLTFVESLNNIRLGHATRLLIDTTLNIAEISFKCGFNNLSYFNRIFKKKYQCTPKEFRDNYRGTRTFV
ncbi:helix-turn-helix domain-containing protein [Leadbetterella byssophila]|uniref:Transcriptional regulator, AraC family n=1 Tax=Leadbetterella byssophila (strain DSM 17132 / JCM 16389 / KACC 11308 / NBRC 106382 / 4M15) TaxID=649349 RepID=E4RXX5_LEAB4|nr:AraC family transcriptional regulator [Leadbetterella byssophila]ADQ19072.1 transcriptional regulator, AraC family [Leadbetterella byssophila DSM 17132]